MDAATKSQPEPPRIDGELDVQRLTEHVARQVTERLVKLFPDDAATALVEQAASERERVAATVDSIRDFTSWTAKDALNGILLDGATDEPTDDGEATTSALDPVTRHEGGHLVGGDG